MHCKSFLEQEPGNEILLPCPARISVATAFLGGIYDSHYQVLFQTLGPLSSRTLVQQGGGVHWKGSQRLHFLAALPRTALGLTAGINSSAGASVSCKLLPLKAPFIARTFGTIPWQSLRIALGPSCTHALSPEPEDHLCMPSARLISFSTTYLDSDRSAVSKWRAAL